MSWMPQAAQRATACRLPLLTRCSAPCSYPCCHAPCHPQERPDAILPTMGGQTGLNLAKALSEVRLLIMLACGL